MLWPKLRTGSRLGPGSRPGPGSKLSLTLFEVGAELWLELGLESRVGI